MTLKKLIKEKDKIVEKYYIEAPFMRSCKVPEGYRNIVDAISSKLEDYCMFNKADRKLDCMEFVIGGLIPNDMWNGIIETTDGESINLEIVQSYEQPLGRLSGDSAEMKYVNNISEGDLNIIRDAFTSSGLERID